LTQAYRNWLIDRLRSKGTWLATPNVRLFTTLVCSDAVDHNGVPGGLRQESFAFNLFVEHAVLVPHK
jgi:hypothetical protein